MSIYLTSSISAQKTLTDFFFVRDTHKILVYQASVPVAG
jgi:hypothetical protein